MNKAIYHPLPVGMLFISILLFHLFEKFFRSEAVETADIKGTGLGVVYYKRAHKKDEWSSVAVI